MKIIAKKLSQGILKLKGWKPTNILANHKEIRTPVVFSLYKLLGYFWDFRGGL